MNNLACVTCGTAVKDLYRTYNSSVIKLTKCSACAETADKYIEYDGVIVLIDLILFNKEPYRHVLFNSDFKNHWKLAIILLLLKTYSHWVRRSNAPGDFGVKGILITEHGFYISAVITAAGSIAYLAVEIGLIALHEFISRKTYPTKKSILLVWKAIILSNFGQFLLLPSLIWMDLQKDLHLMFVITYSVISQMQALSVVSSTSRPLLLGFLLLGVMVELTVVSQTQQYFYAL